VKTRYKIIIIGVIIVLSSSSLFFHLIASKGIVYPGMGYVMIKVENMLCKKLSGNATLGNCFGINDICEDVYGVLHYDKNRSEVGCSLSHRVDVRCTNLQLATGWEKYSDSVCYLSLKDYLNSRK